MHVSVCVRERDRLNACVCVFENEKRKRGLGGTTVTVSLSSGAICALVIDREVSADSHILSGGVSSPP